jgi:hypothetical protein
LHLFDNIWKVKKSTNPNITLYDDDFDESFEILANKASKRIPIIKQRTKEYLNWRYRNHPTRDYKTFVLKENSMLKGYVIVRKTNVNEKLVGVIVDFLVDSDENVEKIKDLLRVALEHFWDSKVSVVIATSGSLTLECDVLCHTGFRIAPKFMKPSAHFLVIDSELEKNDLEQLKKYDNWLFSFGDYDVF